jgi:O-antigen ligase
LVVCALVAIGIVRARVNPGTLASVALLAVSFTGVAVLNGAALSDRLTKIATSGVSDDLRLTLWDAAERMIRDAPILGLGLGTFTPAYTLYATSVQATIVDKAHNDYLELAAGWGLPAALAWWAMILWVTILCVRGIFVRRRDRVFPLLGVGATLLVGIHSIFDFSLQIPAIAVLYAALLGLGVAQAFPARLVGGHSSEA